MRLDGVGADADDLDPPGRVVLGEGDEGVLEEDDEGAVVAFFFKRKFSGDGEGGGRGRGDEAKKGGGGVSFLLDVSALSLFCHFLSRINKGAPNSPHEHDKRSRGASKVLLGGEFRARQRLEELCVTGFFFFPVIFTREKKRGCFF